MGFDLSIWIGGQPAAMDAHAVSMWLWSTQSSMCATTQLAFRAGDLNPLFADAMPSPASDRVVAG
jgi:hypothetical protein